MKWTDYITSDPGILLGKPTIKGTRISVEFLLERLAGGWTEAMIFESYPHLKREQLLAMYAYLRDIMETERYFPLPEERP
ncbi:MAG TPA: DUF433 domain-containing protein [Cyclobacteriaceae bacterium]